MRRFCSPWDLCTALPAVLGRSIHPLAPVWMTPSFRAFRLDVSQGVTPEMMHKCEVPYKNLCLRLNFLPIQDRTAPNFPFLKPEFLAFSWWNLWGVLGNVWALALLVSALQNCQLCMCHLPLCQLAVLPPPSVSSLSLAPCSTRGHGHGNSSVELGRGSGLGWKETKIPVCVSVTPWLPSADAAGPVPEPAASRGSETGQGCAVAHVQQNVEAKKVWE